MSVTDRPLADGAGAAAAADALLGTSAAAQAMMEIAATPRRRVADGLLDMVVFPLVVVWIGGTRVSRVRASGAGPLATSRQRGDWPHPSRCRGTRVP